LFSQIAEFLKGIQEKEKPRTEEKYKDTTVKLVN